MRIVGLDTWIVSIPHPRPVTWAGVVETHWESVLLRVRTDSDVTGLAQARLHPAWSGTSPRLTAQALGQLYGPLLRGVDPLSAERTKAAVDRVRGWSPAKALLDIALADVRARHAGLPLRTYLGGWTDEVTVSALLTRGPREGCVDELAKAVDRHGFTAVKVKVGGDAREDIARIQDIRNAFGDSLSVRVDANSAYSRREALLVGDALAELGVAHFEDPCPLEPPAHRRELFRRSRVDVLVDRVVDSPAAARQVIDEGARAVSVKANRLGYANARRIVEICEDACVPCVAGLSGESAVGALASLQMCAAYRQCADIPAEESFFTMLPHDVATTALEIRGGKAVLPDSPGLGADLDLRALERFGVRHPA
ncbi:hypothetical protein K8Z49_28375 [Actinomadura madurae]|uniref:mandelate racemase/muconate lactonizing enzyme family protein n=1 Tax=Actinomadura madurae TaxID=1993 RepID=UPI00399A6CBB